MALRATVYCGIAARYQAAPDFGVAAQDIPKDDDIVFESGIGDYQGDMIWTDERTLTTGATEDLDLRGVLADVFGVSVAFVEVVAVLIKSKRNANNTTNLTIGNGTNPAPLGFGAGTQSWILTPESAFLVVNPKAGWPIVAGTGDILKIANAAGASHVYQIKVVGRLT